MSISRAPKIAKPIAALKVVLNPLMLYKTADKAFPGILAEIAAYAFINTSPGKYLISNMIK